MFRTSLHAKGLIAEYVFLDQLPGPRMRTICPGPRRGTREFDLARQA